MTSGVCTFGNSGACAQYANGARTLSSKLGLLSCRATGKPGRTNPAPSRSQVEVDTVNESVARIEAIIGRKVKRDIGQMTEWAKGNLARAAEAIMNTPNPHVGIVTGFYIQHAEPPSPETDGLGGMAHLAAGLANVGIQVTVITDTPCAKAVWAVVDALPMPVNLEVVSS